MSPSFIHTVGVSGKDEGHCCLDVYVSLQTQLDVLYSSEHGGQLRCDDKDAVLFPNIVNNRVMWHQHATSALLRQCIQATIIRANRHRVGQKNPKLYTTHSVKVGGAVECAVRNMNMHEGDAINCECHP